MAEWFESWFDTKYYHILYKNRDEKEAERFIQEIVNEQHLPQKSTILDLCCGKGRHSIYLNQLGYTVLGADLSAKSIAHAKSAENETLQFIVHDMRQSIPARKFDAIFNLFTSFGYFDDNSENLEVLKAIRSNLNKGGVFLIDYINADHAMALLPVSEVISAGGIQFSISKKEENNFITKTIQFSDAGKNYTFVERIRIMRLADFEKMFLETGFEISNVYGDYSLNKFNPDHSERLIIKTKAI